MRVGPAIRFTIGRNFLNGALVVFNLLIQMLDYLSFMGVSGFPLIS